MKTIIINRLAIYLDNFIFILLNFINILFLKNRIFKEFIINNIEIELNIIKNIILINKAFDKAYLRELNIKIIANI